jgi:hypothetical protein
LGYQKVCKKVAILGEWTGLEVANLGLDLLKVEDLGFFKVEIVKELNQSCKIAK